jgi:hypothetical protein
MDHRQVIYINSYLNCLFVCKKEYIFAYVRACLTLRSQRTGVFQTFTPGGLPAVLKIVSYFHSLQTIFRYIEVGLIRLLPNPHVLFIHDYLISFRSVQLACLNQCSLMTQESVFFTKVSTGYLQL